MENNKEAYKEENKKVVKLIKMVESCDKIAFGKIYNICQTFFKNYFFKELPAHLKDFNNDLYQDTMVKFYRYIRDGKYNEEKGANPFNFIFAIAKNVLIDFINKKHPFPFTMQFLDDEDDDKSNYDENITSEEEFKPDKIFMKDLFHIVVLSCAKPHEILVFCYKHFLNYKDKEILELRISDDEIKFEDYNLFSIANFYFKEFFFYYEDFIDSTYKKEYRVPLDKKLNTVARTIYTEYNYTERMEKFGDLKTGNLIFNIFFSQRSKTDQLNDWTNNVLKERARKVLLEGKVCSAARQFSPQEKKNMKHLSIEDKLGFVARNLSEQKQLLVKMHLSECKACVESIKNISLMRENFEAVLENCSAKKFAVLLWQNRITQSLETSSAKTQDRQKIKKWLQNITTKTEAVFSGFIDAARTEADYFQDQLDKTLCPNLEFKVASIFRTRGPIKTRQVPGKKTLNLTSPIKLSIISDPKNQTIIIQAEMLEQPWPTIIVYREDGNQIIMKELQHSKKDKHEILEAKFEDIKGNFKIFLEAK